jgi:hypothetical protein
VQGRDDHETRNFHGHAVAMINAATVPKGRARWTRLNRQASNVVYKCARRPDGADIEQALAIERFTGPNDARVSGMLLQLLQDVQKQ